MQLASEAIEQWSISINIKGDDSIGEPALKEAVSIPIYPTSITTSALSISIKGYSSAVEFLTCSSNFNFTHTEMADCIHVKGF